MLPPETDHYPDLYYRRYKAESNQIEIREGDGWLSAGEVHHQALAGETWTMFCDEEVMAIVGIVPLWGGCFQTWALVSDKAAGHGLWLTRSCKNILAAHQVDNQAHRYQSIVEATNQPYLNWTLALGYEKEAVLKKGAPNKNDLVVLRKLYEG